jgi:hypothetical protein
MKKLRFVSTIGVLVVLLLVAATSAYGGQEKVDVCHITGTYDFGTGEVPIGHVINIADPAYETHIAHGDPEVWELRTLPDGSEVCTATANPVNSPPNALDDDYSTAEDTPVIVSALDGVLGNDADADGDSLSAALVTGPSNGDLNLSADGSFTYEPAMDYSGTDSFTYQATDGTDGSNVATVNLAVNPVNDAPTAVDDAYSTDENTTLTVDAPGVLGNDADADGDSLSAALVTGPSNGDLTLDEDGSFTYTPDADYYGTDSFTYMANDGTEDSNIAIVSITVNPVSEPPTGMTVFITSAVYDGNLGGIAGADAKCQTLADDAGLDGTFKAWLSSGDSATDPNLYSPATNFTESDVPYVDTLGNTIADNWDDLTDGDALQHLIVVDEAQNTVEDGTDWVWVWTNTKTYGTFNDSHGYTCDCDNWTTASDGISGELGIANSSFYLSWTWAEWQLECSTLAHLYCFEQPEPKTVFITSAFYAGYRVGGLDGADAECQGLAVDAGLEGTYKAWLSTDTESAADRLTHATVPYVLVDGTVIAENWTDLTDGSLLAPINLDETGAVGFGSAWTSTQADGSYWGTPGDEDDCTDWSHDAYYGGIGLAYRVDSAWSAGSGDYCGAWYPLYCFEQ